MQRDYFLRFNIAGFSYYEGAIAFRKLRIGKKLKLKPEPTNTYDKHAVEIYFKNYKLGYVPKQDSRKIALLLKYGFDKFQARVQQIHSDCHPESQIDVILYLEDKEVE
ncbi:HIRAN domain-containing protein [Jejuia pallidilutea]|uniref:HIRAN domain-containing protein n=1 Tax=Jejuia pallidilutea TaxID=504487 RepID=A0A090VZJ7_9FLAO|nr:HIRAN domain-containing protein [Jejuia pallidilutea]GAL70190.1 hypothetical protein JCM19302_2765 [Jejuia pallidilutea]GAL88849.1 hypothetical protein JCM19538_1838 [Jejuia pallidilutea]